MLNISFISNLFKAKFKTASDLKKQVRQQSDIAYAIGNAAVPFDAQNIVLVDPEEFIAPFLVNSLSEQGDTVIVLDNDKSLFKYAYNEEEDFILDPRDNNSINWNFLNEIKSIQDFSIYLKLLALNFEVVNKEIQVLGIELFSLTVEQLNKENRLNLKNLYTLIFKAPPKDLANYLSLDLKSDMLDKLSSIRHAYKFIDQLFQYSTSNPKFSSRAMIDAEHSGKLFLPKNQDMFDGWQLALIDYLLLYVSKAPCSEDRRVWFVFNNVEDLEKLHNVKNALMHQTAKHVHFLLIVKDDVASTNAKHVCEKTNYIVVKPSALDMSGIVESCSFSYNTTSLIKSLKNKSLFGSGGNMLIQYENNVFKAEYGELIEVSYSQERKEHIHFDNFVAHDLLASLSIVKKPNPEAATKSEIKQKVPLYKNEEASKENRESKDKPNFVDVNIVQEPVTRPTKKSVPIAPKDLDGVIDLPSMESPVLKSKSQEVINVEDTPPSNKYELPSSKFNAKKKETTGFGASDLKGILK